MIRISEMLQSERNAFFREVLGLPRKCKLPAYGIDPRPIPGTFGLWICLQPQGELKHRLDGRPLRRMAHRICIICPCGQTISAGRLAQHMNSSIHSN